MTFHIKKLCFIKIISVAFIIPLVSCTTYFRYNQKIINDKSYLDSSPLIKLKAPEGITLPIQNDTYNFPVLKESSTLSKKLDISPPE